MHKQMLKQKKGDIELSLNTILGIILAVIAILAILSIVTVIISIFYDSEKEEGKKNGFIELLSAVENSKWDGAVKKIQIPIYLGSGNVIVGFNPNPTESSISGNCGKPTLPYTYPLSISRDLIKCPRNFPCLCLCKADIGGIIPPSLSTLTRFEYIDCQNAVCRPFMDEDKAISFANPAGCDMPIFFSEGTTVVEISKDSAGKVSFNKVITSK